jgi:hypothetical protein
MLAEARRLLGLGLPPPVKMKIMANIAAAYAKSFFNSHQLGSHNMLIAPASARYTVESTVDGIRISIPARRNWFIILFLIAWLGGWFFGEVSAATELLNPRDKTPSGFLAFWLLGWTLGGAFCIAAVLWQLAGREILTVNPSWLIHRVEVFGFGLSRTYLASDVKNLRGTDDAPSLFVNQRAWFPPLVGSGYGPIAFDYGARTIRLAPGLEEAEAKMPVCDLLQRLPRGFGKP